MKKRFLPIVSFLLVLVLLAGLQNLLMPKYMSDIVEGALIAEYYDNAGDNDVIFIGDCEVYENISPIRLYEQYGIASYIRGSAQQLIWQSYYLMEETFRYETPKVMVFNVLSMMYDEPQNEAYNRMTLDGMRWSSSKVKSIQASMTDEEREKDAFLSYVFPILRYHTRWKELQKDDFTYYFNKRQISHNGYYMRVDVNPVKREPTVKPLADYRFSENCYDYLDKMRELCEENGTKLVLFKAPSIYPVWYDEWDEQIGDYAKEHDLLYVNALAHLEEIGIDWQTDTYDEGLHLNLSGAEKMSDYLGNILKSETDLPDRRNDKAVAGKWEDKIAYYYAEKEKQTKELEK
ncbi:MAG: SGNH/GDSL hydrolase family protein [Clostridia bacterium]|nr:SGNH/GDSL hydrolase family protein [Clostridia bacterium]